MTRQLIFGTMFAVGLAVSVGAQQPPPNQPDPARGSQSDQREVTVTGCLQPGDAAKPSGTATAPATGAATGEQTGMRAGEGQFILTNARIGSATDASAGTSVAATPATGNPPTGTGTAGVGTGTAGASASTAAAYRLIGGQRDELQKYVNSRVEVKGTLVGAGRPGASPAPGAATGTAAGTGTPTGTGTGTPSTATGSTPSRGSADQQITQSLRVTSVRQVAGSCSADIR